MYLNTFTCLHSNLISYLLETRFLCRDFLNMLLQPFERPLLKGGAVIRRTFLAAGHPAPVGADSRKTFLVEVLHFSAAPKYLSCSVEIEQVTAEEMEIKEEAGRK